MSKWQGLIIFINLKSGLVLDLAKHCNTVFKTKIKSTTNKKSHNIKNSDIIDNQENQIALKKGRNQVLSTILYVFFNL